MATYQLYQLWLPVWHTVPAAIRKSSLRSVLSFCWVVSLCLFGLGILGCPPGWPVVSWLSSAGTVVLISSCPSLTFLYLWCPKGMMLLPAGVSVLALLLLKLFVWLFGFPVSALTRCLALVHLTPNSPCMCRASSLFFPSGCGLMFSMLPSFSVSFVVVESDNDIRSPWFQFSKSGAAPIFTPVRCGRACCCWLVLLCVSWTCASFLTLLVC